MTWPPRPEPLGGRLDVVGVGEAMLLLQAPPPAPIEEADALSVSVAGAELNVCAAVARLGGRAAFLSAVGDDAPGRRVRRAVRELGVADRLLRVDPARPTGLFLRETPADGARRVTYYRAGSAASALDAPAAALLTGHDAPRAVVVSGLTAALGAGPRRLLERLAGQAAAAGTAVVLDVNLRPALGIDEALATMRRLLPHVDLLLLGDDESGPLFDTTDPAEVLARAAAAGVGETVLKGGERGCWLWDEGPRHVPAHPTRAVDTVGAGDAFLGGYLAGRLAGAGPLPAADLGARIAAGVVAHPGDTEGLPDPPTARRLLAAALTPPPGRP
ncbi:sugar kinase [Streptomyces sp. DSM 44915]|uniref:Sugar kinase n=1 Tax=Streptomyces chisholmiae TaxID=3075540 RepID=A0ABU2JUG7_9ACTN|nr:sugar kinase [Streptomyces sp. DSM 44915]MDT0268622.1 sugar kinase [Streptomyces sp. DSM 44915]